MENSVFGQLEATSHPSAEPESHPKQHILQSLITVNAPPSNQVNSLVFHESGGLITGRLQSPRTSRTTDKKSSCGEIILTLVLIFGEDYSWKL